MAGQGHQVGVMDRNRKRSACLVVFFSVVLLVGMTKIHALITLSEESDNIEAFEGQVDTRRMLSSSELESESMRRMTLEAETRRSLASSTFYISYNALSANRVSCPPRSGRSYYTPNCKTATGAVKPYSRGCSTISRCARSS